MSSEKLPEILEKFFNNNIPDYKQKTIAKINPRFSDSLHNANCQLLENGQVLFHNSKTINWWDYALFNDNLQ